MTLRYIAIEVKSPKSIESYSQVIETAIAPHGIPVRWAITAIELNLCKVEAVVRAASPEKSTNAII